MGGRLGQGPVRKAAPSPVGWEARAQAGGAAAAPLVQEAGPAPRARSSAQAGRGAPSGAGLVRTGSPGRSAGACRPPGERGGRGPRRCREVWTGRGDRHTQGQPRWKARCGAAGREPSRGAAHRPALCSPRGFQELIPPGVVTCPSRVRSVPWSEVLRGGRTGRREPRTASEPSSEGRSLARAAAHTSTAFGSLHGGAPSAGSPAWGPPVQSVRRIPGAPRHPRPFLPVGAPATWASGKPAVCGALPGAGGEVFRRDIVHPEDLFGKWTVPPSIS